MDRESNPGCRRCAATPGYGVEPLRGCCRRIASPICDGRVMHKRSSIIIGLLFAATIAADAAAYAQCYAMEFSVESGTLLVSLAIAQIGVLSAWAMLCRPQIEWRWLAPLIGGLVAVPVCFRTLRGPDPPEENIVQAFIAVIGFFWTFAIVDSIGLWLLRLPRLVGNLTPSEARRGWRFSVANLLGLLTMASLLLTMFVRNEILRDAMSATMSLALSCFVLLVVVVRTCNRPWHWILRLGACLAGAFVVARISEMLAVWQFDPRFGWEKFHLVQAIVLVAWLELGPILPSTSSKTVCDAAQEETLSAAP